MSWETSKLNDVLLKTENVNPNSQPENNFHYVDVSSVSREKLVITEAQKLKGAEAPSRARKLIKTNDVIFATIRPTLLRVAIVPSYLNGQICSTGYFVFRPNCKILPKFIFYFLLTNDFMLAMEKLQTGASYPAVTDSQIRELTIKYPTLGIQEKIVTKLDAIFAEIDKATAAAEANIKNAEALFQSYLTEVFECASLTAKLISLEEICCFLNGYAFKSNDAVDYSETQLLRMGNLYNNNLDLTRSPVFYPDSFEEKYSKYILNKDDLVLSLTGTVGKRDYGYAIRIKEQQKKLLLNQRLLKIYNLDKTVIDLNYLDYFFHSNIFLDELYLSANGTRQANLSSEYIKKIKIPIGSLKEQTEFTKKLEIVQHNSKQLKECAFERIKHLTALKQSILQQAFNGELIKE